MVWVISVAPMCLGRKFEDMFVLQEGLPVMPMRSLFYSVPGEVECGTPSDDTERTTSMKTSHGSFVPCARGSFWFDS